MQCNVNRKVTIFLFYSRRTKMWDTTCFKFIKIRVTSQHSSKNRNLFFFLNPGWSSLPSAHTVEQKYSVLLLNAIVFNKFSVKFCPKVNLFPTRFFDSSTYLWRKKLKSLKKGHNFTCHDQICQFSRPGALYNTDKEVQLVIYRTERQLAKTTKCHSNKSKAPS